MSITDLITIVLESQSVVRRQQALQVLRSSGATSPAAARTLAELGAVADDMWQQLVREGAIREGPPDRFYLFEAQRANPRERRLKMLGFYIIIVLIPIVLILVNRHR